MNRHRTCGALLTAAALVFGLPAQSPPMPHVMIVLADDMGLGDTSAYQDVAQNRDTEQIHTPSLERLASLGMRIERGYATSSICSPSRYSMLTGRYPWRSRSALDAGLTDGVVWPPQGNPLIKPGVTTIASMLQSQGYVTAKLGKWHLGLTYRDEHGRTIDPSTRPSVHWARADLTQPLVNCPLSHGFDFFFGHSRSHHTSGPQGGPNTPDQHIGPGYLRSQNGERGFGTYAISATGNRKKLFEQGPNAYLHDSIGVRVFDEAIGFLTDHFHDPASREKPVFMYYGLHSNHGPYTVDDSIGGVPVKGRGRFIAGDERDDRTDFVYQTDVTVGRLISFLEQTDDPRTPQRDSLFDHTIFVFASDNGSEVVRPDGARRRSVGPFRGKKAFIYEGGFRIPLLVSWPAGGIPGGASTDRVVSLVDLYATIARAIDRPLEADEAGDSIPRLDVLRGDTDAPLRPVLIVNSGNPELPIPTRGLIGNQRPSWLAGVSDTPRASDPSPSWNLLFDRRLMAHQRESEAMLMDGEVIPLRELYDLASDPGQTRDLAEAHSDTPQVQRIRHEMVRVIVEGRTRR